MAGQIDVRRTGKRWYIFGSGFSAIRKGTAFFVDTLGRAISINNPAPVFDTKAAAEAVARAFAPGHGIRVDNPVPRGTIMRERFFTMKPERHFDVNVSGVEMLKNGVIVTATGAALKKLQALKRGSMGLFHAETDLPVLKFIDTARQSARHPTKSLGAAIDLYESFRDQPAGETLDVEQPDFSTGLVIGRLSAVEYDTVRGGKREDYRHVFRKRSQPLLCATADGKTLFTVQGAFEFTERGIVDK
jgi:hypothetical protein